MPWILSRPIKRDVEWVREQVIVALAADDDLGELLVLKGGNALRLIHKIGDRASLDLDYSIEASLDSKVVHGAVKVALEVHFTREGYAAFDVRMTKTPRDIPPEQDERPEWGGWRIEFKLISKDKHAQLVGAPEKLSMQALELYKNKKAFRIDVSSHEHVEGAVEVSFGGYPVRVYTPSMIVYEKLRALCQQMEDYLPVSHRSPRPRDFVDITSILEGREAVVFGDRAMLAKIFAAKDVPLDFLNRLAGVKRYHAQGWASVMAETAAGLEGFERCFQRVIRFVEKLKSAGVIDSPA